MKRLLAFIVGTTLSCAAFADATGNVDLGGSGGGTPANGSVTMAMLANLNADTLICNYTASGATPINCTVAQVKTLLAYSFSDISGIVAAAQLPNPTASTLGGIESIAAASHQWVASISILGVPALTQPGFGDLSGSAACSQLPARTGDSTGSAGSCAQTNVALNGVTLSGLATGLLKNTTGTGAPSIATAGTDYAGASSGSFTGTLTGYSSNPTGAINYTIQGNIVSLSAYSAITGTSNSTAMTMTGLATAVKPTHAKTVMVYALEDAGNAIIIGAGSIAAGGTTITFFVGGVSAAPGQVFGNSTGFTASGTKGLVAGWNMIYSND